MQFGFSILKLSDMHLCLWLHPKEDPPQAEWAIAIRQMEAVKASGVPVELLRSLVISDSAAPNTLQRKQLGAIFGGKHVSRRHNALALRVGAALDAARKPGCAAFQSDQKMGVLATGKATYPDATVVCGTIEGDPADPSGATITNPTLLVEVLSVSTEQEDRGNKWRHYQLIPALQEYVLVSEDEARIERYRRLPTGTWEYSESTSGAVQLSTGAVLDLARLYEDLPE